MKLMWLFIQLFAVGWLLLFDGKIHECCICFPPCVIRSNPIYFKELPHNPRTCLPASLLVLPFAHPAFPLYLDYIHTIIYKEGGVCTKLRRNGEDMITRKLASSFPISASVYKTCIVSIRDDVR